MILPPAKNKITCPHCNEELPGKFRIPSYTQIILLLPILILGAYPLYTMVLFKPISSEDLSISEVKSMVVENKLEVLGVISNSSKNEWSSVKIEVEFYDSEGAFIGEDSQYLNSAILPLSNENFKVVFRTLPSQLQPGDPPPKFKLTGGRSH